MKYMTTAAITELSKKSKKCVYCGFTNNVGKTILRPVER